MSYTAAGTIEGCTCVECFKKIDVDGLNKGQREVYDELKIVFAKAGLLNMPVPPPPPPEPPEEPSGYKIPEHMDHDPTRK